MSGGIFVSYRREDAKHPTGRLVDRLSKTFTDGQIFIDVDNIAPGLDFRKVLADKVQACDVLLAVIGPGWLDARNTSGVRRLDDPRDFVRIELESALTRDVRVIPVLVDGADMPPEDVLPPPLQPLAYRNAVRLSYERFGADADDLTRALTAIVVPQVPRGATPKAAAAKPSRVPAEAMQAAANDEAPRGLPWSVFAMPLVSGVIFGALVFYEANGARLGPTGFFRLASVIGLFWLAFTAFMILLKRRSIRGINLFFFWFASLPWLVSISLNMGDPVILHGIIVSVASILVTLALWRLTRRWQRKVAVAAAATGT